MRRASTTLWLILILCGMFSCTYAQDNSLGQNSNSIATGSTNDGIDDGTDIETPTNLIVYCPPIEQLVRNPTTLKWEGKNPNLWEGYEMSFETKLDHFVGAQWHGTKIGQLFCIYHSARQVSFPVLILVHALIFEPSAGKWGDNLGDTRNCVATDQKDCPFTPQQPPKEGNPYEELREMKTAPPSQELGY